MSNLENTEPSSAVSTSHETEHEVSCDAFELVREKEISSLNLVMEEYRHRETGASHYHLNCDNPENVFLVAFRTVPMDSTGVAHILEHTALCGSEKYPVRDPFFMMIRRSLNTFMNAFTSSDWTAYPFASKNRKDYFNLLNVYLDAVFFSRLHELDFAQEGHRLEFTEPDNPESQLQYKGVVFNEMKGAMSSTNSVLWQTISKHLFPTTTYHYNSGGEPENIPDLSYEQLKSFYKSHYHPSNAVFMTFGDIGACELQQKIEQLALSRFTRLDINIEVGDEKRYSSPVCVEEHYCCEDTDQDRTHVVTAWLLGKSINLSELFKAQLLSSVLLDNSASALLKVLETTDLGSSPSPMCGLEDSNREMSFICGLEGCATDSTGKVEAMILQTLTSIAENGVPQEQVEAALHQLELSQREITGDSYPYGLQLILAGLSTAVHRGDPIKLLDIDPVLEELRNEIKNPQFIPDLIRKLLLTNQHRLTLTLKPDLELAGQQVANELKRLDKIRQSLSAEEISHIIKQSKALAARQLQEDNPDLLPKVGLEDIPKTIEQPSARLSSIRDSHTAVSFFNQGTNGLCYQHSVLELPALEEDLLEALPYYTSCLTELGIGNKDYTEVQTWQSRVSGGIHLYSNVRSQIDDEQQAKGVLVLSSKALSKNHQPLTELLAQSLQNVRFDEGQRIKELIEQLCARRENSITSQGHSLAITLASSLMSPAAKLSHKLSGLESIKRIKQLRSALSQPEQIEQIIDKFQRLHQKVLSAPRRFLLIGESANESAMCCDLDQYWDSAPDSRLFKPMQLPQSRETVLQAWTTSTQVNFCAKAYPTVPSNHPDHAPLTVLAGFMRNGFLHRAIRETGGAYGGGAEQDANSASFRFFSYRDPRLLDTLTDFDRAVEWVVNEKHQPRQLEEAILGVISSMDKPSSPAGEASRVFYNDLFGRDLNYLLGLRQRILDVTLNDLRRVASTWLHPEKASIGIITSRGVLQESGLEAITEVNL